MKFTLITFFLKKVEIEFNILNLLISTLGFDNPKVPNPLFACSSTNTTKMAKQGSIFFFQADSSAVLTQLLSLPVVSTSHQSSYLVVVEENEYPP
jgi:hypothetical protein